MLLPVISTRWIGPVVWMVCAMAGLTAPIRAIKWAIFFNFTRFS
jgi:hypothetical protein